MPFASASVGAAAGAAAVALIFVAEHCGVRLLDRTGRGVTLTRRASACMRTPAASSSR
jgi:hypothetical protein